MNDFKVIEGGKTAEAALKEERVKDLKMNMLRPVELEGDLCVITAALSEVVDWVASQSGTPRNEILELIKNEEGF